MYKYILLFLLSFPVHADNWFASAGVAWNSQSISGPEIQLDSWLFESELGYEWEFNKNVAVQGYFRHTSGIQTNEEGFGLNPIGARIVATW